MFEHFDGNDTVTAWIEFMLKIRSVKASFIKSSKTGIGDKGCPSVSMITLVNLYGFQKTFSLKNSKKCEVKFEDTPNRSSRSGVMA